MKLAGKAVRLVTMKPANAGRGRVWERDAKGTHKQQEAYCYCNVMMTEGAQLSYLGSLSNQRNHAPLSQCDPKAMYTLLRALP